MIDSLTMREKNISGLQKKLLSEKKGSETEQVKQQIATCDTRIYKHMYLVIQMTKIHFLLCIWLSFSVLSSQRLHPLEFPVIRVIKVFCYVKKGNFWTTTHRCGSLPGEPTM